MTLENRHTSPLRPDARQIAVHPSQTSSIEPNSQQAAPDLSDTAEPTPSPTPATAEPQASPQPSPSSSTDDWDLAMIRTQNELNNDSILANLWGKRGF